MGLDFGEFFRRITTSPGQGGLEAAAQAREERATRAAEEALALQKDAAKRAELAAIPAVDKESTRLASEAAMRKLLAASGFNFSGSPLGAAPLGFSQLLGGQ